MKVKQLSTYILLWFFSMGMVLFMGACKKEGPEKTNAYYKKGVGKAANDLLSSKEFDKLTLEILHPSGFAPTEQSKSNLLNFLRAVLNKPAGIEIKTKVIPSTGGGVLSDDNIRDLEDKERTVYNDGKHLTACLLFVDAEYAGNSNGGKVLGIAYRSTSMCVFQKTIKSLSGGLGQPDRTKAETTVMSHEVGHILGLVNIGTGMVTHHQDTDNGHHCDNKNCLMFWAVENGDFLTNLIGSSPIPELDNNCQADLKNNGGK